MPERWLKIPHNHKSFKGTCICLGFYNKVILQGNANITGNYVELRGYKWNLTQLLVHEMTHCFQYDKLGLWKSKPIANIPDWKWEGYAEYVASTQNDGNSYYRGVIIAGKQYKDLASLKNQPFAFVEKGSSSGYKFPLALFLQRNIDPYRYFSHVYYLGSHANVVESVATGKVAAGATWDGYLEQQMGKKPEKVNIILKTDQIPYDAIVVSRKKGAAFARQFRNELLRINKTSKTKDGRLVLAKDLGFPYSGYVVHSPAIYSVVRQTGQLIKGYKPPAESNVKR